MYTGLHGKRGGAKEGSHVHRSTWEEGRGQRGVTCTWVYMGRGEGPKRGHMYTGLHGKRGGAKEGSHVYTGLLKGVLREKTVLVCLGLLT